MLTYVGQLVIFVLRGQGGWRADAFKEHVYDMARPLGQIRYHGQYDVAAAGVFLASRGATMKNGADLLIDESNGIL